MDISGALDNTLDLSHQVSLGDDEVFYKSAKKRKNSRPNNLNLSSKKRKKVVSSKISNSSIGSISKDSLRVKNKHLALEVQKAKIILSELNRQYVTLQQENQEAWVMVRRKRQEVNEVQNDINAEATDRIRKNLEVVNGVVRKFMSGLFEDVMYKHVEENPCYDHKEREMFDNVNDDYSLVEQPFTETFKPDEEAVDERLSRKIRRSSFVHDVRGPDEHYSRRSGSTLAQKTIEKDSPDDLQSDYNCEMNKLLTLSDNKEEIDIIPIMMLSPENDNNNFCDIDESVVCNSPPSPIYNKQNTPMVKNFSQGLKSQNRFPSRKPNFSISGKEVERDVKNSIKIPSVASKNSQPVKENKPSQAKKILLSSRDREKNFNVREMFMPKTKTKSKNRSKTKVAEANPEPSNHTVAENKCIFDFDGESPFILSSKTKADATLDVTSQDSPKTGRSKMKIPRIDVNDAIIEPPGKSKSRSKKKYKGQKDDDYDDGNSDDGDEDFFIPMKQLISEGNESSMKNGLRSRSRCREKKDTPKDLVEDSRNSVGEMEVESPDKSTVHMSRSRSKRKSNITNIKADKLPSASEKINISEACSDPVGKKASGLLSDFSSVDGQCENTYESKNGRQVMEPSTTYSVPTKVDSPDLPSKARGRSRSRGRPKKDQTVEQSFINRGRSRSRGRANDRFSEDDNAVHSSVKTTESEISPKGLDNSGIEGTEVIASDVYSITSETDSAVHKASLGRCRRSRSRGRPRKDNSTQENKTDSAPLSSPLLTQNNGMSRVIAKPKNNPSTTINVFDEYSLPIKTNSPKSKVSTERKSRSRSKGKQVNSVSRSAELRISLERNGTSHSNGRLKKDGLRDERNTETLELYSVSLNSSSPQSRASFTRRGRSRSRNRLNNEDSASDLSGQKSEEEVEIKSRSRSRNRLKTDSTTVLRNTDSSSPLKSKSPESSHSKQSRKSRGRSQSRSILASEGKKSDTSQLYSIPLSDEIPRPKEIHDRSCSKEVTKENLGMDTELYTIPLKKSSPDVKQSEKGALRRGRSRSRGRPKKDSSITDIISNQPQKYIASCEEPSNPNTLTPASTIGQSVEEPNSVSTIQTTCERDVEPSTDMDSSESKSSFKTQKKSRSRGRSKGQAVSEVYSVPMKMESPNSNSLKLDSRKSRSKSRELKQTTDTGKSTSESRSPQSIQSAEPSCLQEQQQTSRTENKARRSEYESSGEHNSGDNLDSNEDEFCQVLNFFSEKTINSTSKIRSLKSGKNKQNEPGILSKKNSVPTSDEPTIQILIEDTEAIAENACKIERLGQKFNIVTASPAKSHEFNNKDTIARPIYSAPVKMDSSENKISSRRGRSRSRARANSSETPSRDLTLNSEVGDVYNVRDSPKSPSVEAVHGSGRTQRKIHPIDTLQIDTGHLDCPDPTRNSKTNKNGHSAGKENLFPAETKSPLSPVANSKDMSVFRNSISHSKASNNRKRKLEDNDSGELQGSKKLKEKIDDKNMTESSKTSSTLKANPWAAKAMKARLKSQKLSDVEKLVRESLNVFEPKFSLDQPEKESDRNSLNEATRKSRRAAGGISYKEPSLCSKLRREDVIEKQKARLSGKVMD